MKYKGLAHRQIYIIINIKNNKTYIGKHKGDIFNDDYWGSGKLIRKAIDKYGIDEFNKYVLWDGNCTEKEINNLEKYYIAYFRNIGKAEYNLADGGEGGDMSRFIDYERLGKLSSMNMKGRVWVYKNKTDKLIKSSELSKYINNGWKKGRTFEFSEEGLKNISEKAKDYFKDMSKSEHEEFCRKRQLSAIKQHKNTPEDIKKKINKKISKSNKKFWKNATEEYKAEHSKQTSIGTKKGFENYTYSKEELEKRSKRRSDLNKKCRWYNNGKINKYCENCPGKEWKLGMLKDIKGEKASCYGKHPYSDGENQIYLKDNELPPKGYIAGTKFKVKQIKNIKKLDYNKEIVPQLYDLLMTDCRDSVRTFVIKHIELFKYVKKEKSKFIGFDYYIKGEKL